MPRWAGKALAVGPAVVISTLVVTALGVLLPPAGGIVVFYGGLGVGVVLLAGKGEGLFARVLLWARAARNNQLPLLAPALALVCRAGLGPPLIEIRVDARDHRDAVTGWGRRTVVVGLGVIDGLTRGAISNEKVAALLTRQAALVLGGWTRNDPFLGYWCLPFEIIHAVVAGLAAGARALAGIFSLAWRARAVCLTIAIVQATQQGMYPVSLLLVVLGVVSYGAPIWRRRWQHRLQTAGDAAAIAAGLGPPLAGYLRRCPFDPDTAARIRVLELSPGPAPTPARPVGLVRSRV